MKPTSQIVRKVFCQRSLVGLQKYNSALAVNKTIVKILWGQVKGEIVEK